MGSMRLVLLRETELLREILKSKEFETYEQHVQEMPIFVEKLSNIYESKRTYEEEVQNVLKKLKVSS